MEDLSKSMLDQIIGKTKATSNDNPALQSALLS